ncbi:MAG: glycosyltransferase family 4 protein [Nitrospiraceae bacterium]
MGKIDRLVYIANARLPTEKAHGYQITKMCEAFANDGVQVRLLHPRRHQLDPALARSNVYEFYGVPPIFAVSTLSNPDVIRLERVVPGRLFPAVFLSHALTWGLYAAFSARKEKADLYYTRDPTIAYWLVRFGLPTVYEAHVVPSGARRWLLQRIAEKKPLLLVVAITSHIRERLIGMGFAAERVGVFPDGVDLSLFDGLPSKGECRQRLGLPEERAIIGYVGRFRTLEMEKGIPELVEAMADVRPVNGSEPLLLCVGGPMETVPIYLDHARRLGVSEQRLQFVDRVPNREVPYWIRSCDVVTIPWPWTEFSAYFTSPLKLFEYMAADVPIVASDLPSIGEVLRHGENACLVEAGNPRALAEGIDRVLGDDSLSSKLAQHARREASNYTWKQRAERVLKHVVQYL